MAWSGAGRLLTGCVLSFANSLVPELQIQVISGFDWELGPS